MVKELGVAYYGNLIPDRALEDLKEIKKHGCNAIILAVSEYNFKIWRTNIYRICQHAKNLDLTLYINLWAYGGVFGGEAPSFFLHDNVDHRQILSISGKKAPAACFNSPVFKNYLLKSITPFAKKDFVDGFFWDEPHYYYSSPTSKEYYCRCKYCQQLYEELMNEPMPNEKTSKVEKFKEHSIVRFLKIAAQKVKRIDPRKKNIVCVIPPPIETGIKNWDYVCSTLKSVIDVFSSDPYWLLYKKSLEYVEKYTKKTVELAHKYDLESQLWCLAFLVPKRKQYELKEAIAIFDKYEVDSIFSWCYRGAEGMSVSSRDPQTVWQLIGEAYNKLRRKYGLE